MHFVRRSAYHSLSVLLFIFLVLTAWSTTATLTFSKPDRLESWLSESKLYDHFIANAIQQSQKSIQNGQVEGGSHVGDFSLGDPGVQQAVESAFSPQTVQNAVNTFLDANYEWLNGRTATPEFTVDLTQAKAALANNLAAYAQQRATTLPRCSVAQTRELATNGQSFDPLTATCLPIGLTPVMAAEQVKQQLANSQDFLANPVITAQTLNQGNLQNNTQQSQPYYVKLAGVPRAYRLATKLPWIVAGLALLSGVGVVFLAATKRKGVKRLGTLFISAGLVILLLILVSSTVLHRLENKVFTASKVGQLQASLVDFAHRAQSALAKVDLWFGIGFVVAGVIVYLLLRFVWPTPKPDQIETPEPPASEPTQPTPKVPTLIQL